MSPVITLQAGHGLGKPMALEDVTGKNIVIDAFGKVLQEREEFRVNWPFCKQIGKK